MPDNCASPIVTEVPAKKLRPVRLTGMVVSVPCWTVLVVGFFLTASSKGDGTHTQIGLPACRAMVVNGVPCPSCGLTTSITAAVHGNFGASVRANVFGTLLFFALVLTGAVGLVQTASGSDILGRIFRRRWWFFFGLLIVGLLIGWAIKLAIGYNTGQYPTH
ncbi:MAG: DUF2752 domain-containing protein [bacterium]|nr:DUF2752 domain-containing protein [bacterium]